MRISSAWCAAHFFPGPGTPCSNASSVHQCLMMAAEDGRRRLKGRIEAPPVGRPHPIHPGRGRSLTYNVSHPLESRDSVCLLSELATGSQLRK